MVISGRLPARCQVEGFAHSCFDEALININMALLAGVDAHVPGGVGVVEVKEVFCFGRWVGHNRFFGTIAAIQARKQDDDNKNGYIGKVADGWNFP
jgi:hypothetical protein